MKAKVKTGIAAVVVFVYYHHCFVLVIVSAGQTPAPRATKHLAFLELECDLLSCAFSLCSQPRKQDS